MNSIIKYADCQAIKVKVTGYKLPVTGYEFRLRRGSTWFKMVQCRGYKVTELPSYKARKQKAQGRRQRANEPTRHYVKKSPKKPFWRLLGKIHYYIVM
jgi:uncharacterized protein YcgI (DUF1989 family)